MTNPYEQNPHPEQQPGEQGQPTGSEPTQPYGSPDYSGSPSYGDQPSGGQTYGNQPSGGQSYGDQSYGNPPSSAPSAADPYGSQPPAYGAQDPYAAQQQPGYGAQNPYSQDPYAAQGGYGATPAPYGGYGYGAPRPHPRGTAVLVLGILSIPFSIGCIGLVLGIIAVVLGGNALKEIDANPSAYTNRQNVNVGRILGIVGIGIFAVLVVIAVATGAFSNS